MEVSYPAPIQNLHEHDNQLPAILQQIKLITLKTHSEDKKESAPRSGRLSSRVNNGGQTSSRPSQPRGVLSSRMSEDFTEITSTELTPDDIKPLADKSCEVRPTASRPFLPNLPPPSQHPTTVSTDRQQPGGAGMRLVAGIPLLEVHRPKPQAASSRVVENQLVQKWIPDNSQGNTLVVHDVVGSNLPPPDIVRNFVRNKFEKESPMRGLKRLTLNWNAPRPPPTSPPSPEASQLPKSVFSKPDEEAINRDRKEMEIAHARKDSPPPVPVTKIVMEKSTTVHSDAGCQCTFLTEDEDSDLEYHYGFAVKKKKSSKEMHEIPKVSEEAPVWKKAELKNAAIQTQDEPVERADRRVAPDPPDPISPTRQVPIHLSKAPILSPDMIQQLQAGSTAPGNKFLSVVSVDDELWHAMLGSLPIPALEDPLKPEGTPLANPAAHPLAECDISAQRRHHQTAIRVIPDDSLLCDLLQPDLTPQQDQSREQLKEGVVRTLKAMDNRVLELMRMSQRMENDFVKSRKTLHFVTNELQRDLPLPPTPSVSVTPVEVQPKENAAVVNAPTPSPEPSKIVQKVEQANDTMYYPFDKPRQPLVRRTPPPLIVNEQLAKRKLRSKEAEEEEERPSTDDPDGSWLESASQVAHRLREEKKMDLKLDLSNVQSTTSLAWKSPPNVMQAAELGEKPSTATHRSTALFQGGSTFQRPIAQNPPPTLTFLRQTPHNIQEQNRRDLERQERNAYLRELSRVEAQKLAFHSLVDSNVPEQRHELVSARIVQTPSSGQMMLQSLQRQEMRKKRLEQHKQRMPDLKESVHTYSNEFVHTDAANADCYVYLEQAPDSYRSASSGAYKPMSYRTNDDKSSGWSMPSDVRRILNEHEDNSQMTDVRDDNSTQTQSILSYIDWDQVNQILKADI